jgi:GTP cyclohydrolase I
LAAIATVADIMEAMEVFAPLHLAESWDNCGLQIGSRAWTVGRIRLALDPTTEVIQAAARDKVDLIITHHPLIFHPLRSIDLQTPVGRTIESALNAKTALYCAHTNLDSARQGVNDALAGAIGLKNTAPLVPADNPLDDANAGMGRIGRLPRVQTLKGLIAQIKASFRLDYIRYAGNPELKIDQAAVCSGSGSSLIPAFLSTAAQVYISGDLRYHDARDIQEAGRALIDIGHFHSERLILDPLAGRLKETADAKGWQLDIQVCRLQRDPFAVS